MKRVGALLLSVVLAAGLVPYAGFADEMQDAGSADEAQAGADEALQEPSAEDSVEGGVDGAADSSGASEAAADEADAEAPANLDAEAGLADEDAAGATLAEETGAAEAEASLSSDGFDDCLTFKSAQQFRIRPGKAIN